METCRIFTKLFTKQGNLTPSDTFSSCGHTWRRSLFFSENHDVPAIDLKLECLEIESGKFLSMKIEFRNETTSEKQEFSHVFDRERHSFCFRRIVTGVRHTSEDGKTIVSFPIDRFLKVEEIDEEYDAPEQKKWPFYAPFTWNVLEDGSVEGDSIKTCFNRFEFRIVLTHLETLTYLPELAVLPNWPKGNGLSVQTQFFEAVWPEIRLWLFSLKGEKSTPGDRRKLFDILGIYYHQWKFDDERRVELEKAAHRLGFTRMMNGVVLENGFSRMMASVMTCDIWRDSEAASEDVTSSFEYEDTLIIDVPELETGDVPWTFEIGYQSMQWNVHFFRSKFHETEFLSVAAMLIGSISGFPECTMDIKVPSQNLCSTVRRRLNAVQNTMSIPTFCRIDQLTSKRDIEISLNLQMTSSKSERHASDFIEMPGINDVFLSVEEQRIAVNRHFLAHHSKFFEPLFFNTNFEEHKLKTIEIGSASHKETLHFLDALYHGTKLFKVSEYYQTLRKADEWICEKVIRIVGKGVRNTKCSSVNKRKLAKKFRLKLADETRETSISDAPPLKKPRVQR